MAILCPYCKRDIMAEINKEKPKKSHRFALWSIDCPHCKKHVWIEPGVDYPWEA